MPSETEKTESAPKPKASTSSSQPAADKYTVERLTADADKLVGYPSYVVAGALNETTGSLTVDQAQQAVKKFLNSEVKEG